MIGMFAALLLSLAAFLAVKRLVFVMNDADLDQEIAEVSAMWRPPAPQPPKLIWYRREYEEDGCLVEEFWAEPDPGEVIAAKPHDPSSTR